MTSKFLQIFKPFVGFIPNTRIPSQDLTTKTRLLFSLGVFVIYSIISSIPLIGVQLNEADPFAFLQTITASTHGSLITLGVGPLLAAGVLMYILSSAHIIKVDTDNPSEKNLYNCTLKVLVIIFTIIGASLLMTVGFFGDNLTLVVQLLIILQLIIVSILIIYLDELVSKGWGFGSGLALFIAGGVCLQIFQGLFALQPVQEGGNLVTSARGIILAFIFWSAQEGPITAFGQLFFRYSPNPADNLNLPTLSLLSLLSTIIIIFILNYIGLMKIKANIQDLQNEGNNNMTISQFNIINLLFIPIIITYVIFSSLTFISQIIWRGADAEGNTDFFANFLVHVLGIFRQNPETSQWEAIDGLVYFLTPPRSLFGPSGVFDISGMDTLLPSIARTLIYAIIFISLTLLILKGLLKLSGTNTIHEGILLQSKDISGDRSGNRVESAEYNKNNNLFQVVSTWGLLVLILITISDMMGVLGTGIGVYLCISIIKEYIAIIKGRKVSSMRVLNFYI